MSASASSPPARPLGQRFLDGFERLGNKLPDPAMIFLFAMLLTWIASFFLSAVQFTEIDPRTVVRDASGQVTHSAPLQVRNLLSGQNFALFLSRMVKTFSEFPPLGVVLVAMMGVGVAEYTGFIKAGLKYLLRITPASLLTPMLALVSIVSHSAGDTGFVVVIPLGGVVFAAAGRHPVAGICAAFAGVSGGLSATFLPSSLDPLLQGFTQAAAQIIDPARLVNPLCNWYFMSASSVLVMALTWLITDRVIEPRLNATLPLAPDESAPSSRMDEFSAAERRGFWAGMATFVFLAGLLFFAAFPADSPFRAKDGGLTSSGAPLMDALVPFIGLFFLIPGIVHGYVSGSVKSHRDVIRGASLAVGGMGYFLIMAFCAAQFTYLFRESNLGALIALKGASFLKGLALPGGVTVVGLVLLSATVNLLIGSASAKWALLAPILVPMLMQLGISPEFTQAAYRIGDSSTNIITPLLTYFPLIVVFCQRHAKSTGAGTLLASMFPYSMALLTCWIGLLLLWWGLGLPLGVQASYTP